MSLTGKEVGSAQWVSCFEGPDPVMISESEFSADIGQHSTTVDWWKEGQRFTDEDGGTAKRKEFIFNHLSVLWCKANQCLTRLYLHTKGKWKLPLIVKGASHSLILGRINCRFPWKLLHETHSLLEQLDLWCYVTENQEYHIQLTISHGARYLACMTTMENTNCIIIFWLLNSYKFQLSLFLPQR